MKHKTLFAVLDLALLLGILIFVPSGMAGAQGPEPHDNAGIQAALGTAFTYQGRLDDDGSAANGTYDFEFKLYDAGGGGGQVGSTITKGNIIVVDGLFTVELDFGDSAFTGEARWLEIGVRAGSSTGAHTILTPRQPLTPVPYALALPNLRTQSGATSPNIIGGYSGNSVTSGVEGATISGGGRAPSGDQGYNTVTDDYGTIGGGNSNAASGSYATVGGGYDNEASGSYATVGGGISNRATGLAATVGGGSLNEASGDASMVMGGFDNTAQEDYSFAAGVRAKAYHKGAFVWADSTLADFASTAEDQFLVRANGGAVFTGTKPYGAMLDVTNLSTMYAWGIRGSGPSIGVYGYSTSIGVSGDGDTGVQGHSVDNIGVHGSSVNGVGLYAHSSSGNPIEAYGSSTLDREFYVSNTGNVYIDGTFNPGGADFAEMLPAVKHLEPGDVLVIGSDGKLTRSTQAYESAVVGVYSAQPGFLGGANEGTDLTGKIPLAILGVVPVKASAENGIIQPGYLLVASTTPGHAMKSNSNPPVGTVIGKALERLEEGTGVIQMLVMLQ